MFGIIFEKLLKLMVPHGIWLGKEFSILVGYMYAELVFIC